MIWWKEFKRRYIRYKAAQWNCWLQLIKPINYLIFSKEKCQEKEEAAIQFVQEFINEKKRLSNIKIDE